MTSIEDDVGRGPEIEESLDCEVRGISRIWGKLVPQNVVVQLLIGKLVRDPIVEFDIILGLDSSPEYTIAATRRCLGPAGITLTHLC